MRMTIHILALILVTAPFQGMHAQRPAKVRNLDITIHDNKAVVHFDIKTRKPGTSHLVHLEFLDQDYNLISPKLVSGDLGPGISAGPGKRIEWDITNDVQLLGSRVTPIIFIDGNSKQFSKTGGPKNAFLSMLLPGMGDYFVADRHQMTIKPWMRTVSSLGLIGLGIYAGSQRYLGEGRWELVLKPDSWRYDGMDRFTERYYEGELQYCWFKGDREVLISVGAAIWAADIIWVLAKGSNNVKYLKATSRGSGFKLGYLPGGAGFQYSCTF